MAKATYVVALKREARNEAPTDWLSALESIEGVRVVGASATRAQFEGDEETLARVRSRLGRYLHIEPEIPHQRVAIP